MERTGSAPKGVIARIRFELSRDAQLRANRTLTWFHDEGGMLVIKARLPPEAGQMFIKAIEAAAEEIPAAEISAES